MDLKDQFDSAESFAFYLSKSLFFIHVGSNDLGLFWNFRKQTGVEEYAKLLSAELSKQLQVHKYNDISLVIKLNWMLNHTYL